MHNNRKYLHILIWTFCHISKMERTLPLQFSTTGKSSQEKGKDLRKLIYIIWCQNVQVPYSMFFQRDIPLSQINRPAVHILEELCEPEVDSDDVFTLEWYWRGCWYVLCYMVTMYWVIQTTWQIVSYVGRLLRRQDSRPFSCPLQSSL